MKIQVRTFFKYDCTSFSLLTLLPLHCALSCLTGRGAQVTLRWRMLHYLSDPCFSPSFETTCFSFLCAWTPRTPFTGFTVHWNRTAETDSAGSQLFSRSSHKHKGLLPSVHAQILSRSPAEQSRARWLKDKMNVKGKAGIECFQVLVFILSGKFILTLGLLFTLDLIYPATNIITHNWPMFYNF